MVKKHEVQRVFDTDSLTKSGNSVGDHEYHDKVFIFLS